MLKKPLGISVLEASRQRISLVFDRFQKICISFSGGKDSTVMLHLVMEEAKKRSRRVGVMFIDWEAQYKLTIDHIRNCYTMYKDWIDPYWISLPLLTINSCSMHEPEWVCWDPDKREVWVRDPEPGSITDGSVFPFYYPKMTFEEFVPKFGEWYGAGEKAAIFVGIRTDESLNRLRTIGFIDKGMFENLRWTTKVGENSYSMFPIYDWKAEDIWAYHGKNPLLPHNKVYELMYRAGLTLHQMRICEPFSDQARRSLWLYHLIEPETWGKVANRVAGANSAALYCKDKGSILGNGVVAKPDKMTWEQYARFLLDSMPKKTAEHYRSKILVYLKWCKDHNEPVPDFAEKDMGAKDIPSWRRISKAILKGDYWLTMLCFSPQKTSNLEKYKSLMESRKQKWGIEI